MKYLILFIISLTWSCKQNALDQSDVKGNIQTGKEYLWPGATANVCWEESLSKSDWERFSGLRQKIAEAVTEQYQLAGFKFTGWQKCEPSSRGIRVQSWVPSMNISPLGMVKSFGARLDGLMNGLGFYVELEPELKKKYCQNEDFCAIGTALHEFGHALGLQHEMNRPGSPCPDDQTGGWGAGGDAFTLPQYDTDSIMNYCALHAGAKIGRRPELSPTDIAIIKELYSTMPLLPAQKACQDDGFSWVSGGMSACCRTANNKSDPSKPYPVCPADFKSDFNAEFPKKGEKAPSFDRFLSEAKVLAKAQLPWQGKLATIKCWSGEVKGTLEKDKFKFSLVQPLDPNFQKFFCKEFVFYNGEGVDTSTEAVIFAKQFEIPIGQESTVDLTAPEGIRVSVAQGKLQITPEIAQKIAAALPSEPPPLGIHATSQITAIQDIKVKNLKGKITVMQSTLLCDIAGIEKSITSGGTLEEYDDKTKINEVKILEYNFPELKSPATCRQIKIVFRRLSDKKNLETSLNLRTPITVVPGKNNILEFDVPACVQSFAKAANESETTCDWSKASQNNGWGWDEKNKKPCPPAQKT